MLGLSRIAILADIHGNFDALDAVLADAATQGLDGYVFAGDLVMNGPRPAETLDRIVGLHAPGVIGNTDQEVLAARDPAGQWTAERIGADGCADLRSLPLEQRFTPPSGSSPNDDLLIVHSTPRSCWDLLILTPHPLGTTFTQTTSLDEAAQMLGDACANLIVYGHIHYVSEGVIAGQRVMSIGSVGYPFDGDQRAAYAIAEWSGQTWSITQRRVAYDYERVARMIEQSDQPFASRYAKMLRAANWFPRPDS
jgi:diadenosine tetraphosphatase ApaH/serine/threonine PP2A family protein phosphatase